MRNYHLIINGYSKDALRQIKELYGFAKKNLPNMEEGTTFIFGKDKDSVMELSSYMREKVYVLYAPEYYPEAVTEKLAEAMEEQDLYLFGNDYAAAELSVRTAAKAGGCSMVSVHACEEQEDCLLARKMTYSNHMEATFRMKKGPFVLSVAKGIDQEVIDKSQPHIEEEITLESPKFIVSSNIELEENEQQWTDAKLIIAAGRGVRSKENIKFIEDTAESLGGALGISRPAAMNAWAPMNRLIGVSGAMLSPEICITAGVSGAAAFYAGIEKSKLIIAVNTDEKAPIMKKADIGIVDDFIPVFEALKQLAK